MNEKRLKQLKNGISDRIKQILEEKDWFQQEIVDRVAKIRNTEPNKSNISQILNGKVNLTLEMIVDLEDALGEKIIEIKS